MNKRLPKLARLILHIPHGLVFGYGVFMNAAFGLGWLFLILVYQLWEDYRIHDNSYLDIRGYMAGGALGALLYQIWSWT